MKILKIRPQQKDIRAIIETDEGSIQLSKFGKEAICVNPPEKLNKQSIVYLSLKKAFTQSDYFNEDLHLNNRQLHHIMELQQRLKMFIGKEI